MDKPWAAEMYPQEPMNNGHHMVVVDGVDGDSVHIRDPWEGTSYTITLSDFTHRWSGIGAENLTEKSMSLIRIHARSERSYIVTFLDDDGAEKAYEFTISAGQLSVIQASEEFGKDASFYGRTDLIYKAVSAFHAATQEKYGRPEYMRPE